jgi:GDPmannose 4,6-dehydratase
MWLMLQRERADDYVIATGVSHSVRDLVEVAFAHAGLDWRSHVKLDPKLIRPAEVGAPDRRQHRKPEPSSAGSPDVDFVALIKMMVDADIDALADAPPALTRIGPEHLSRCLR